MAQTKVIGGGVQSPGVELGIDPTTLAAHVALKPIEYGNFGTVLGHYSVAQQSGSITAMAAGGHSASFRWTDPSRYAVILRIRVGYCFNGAVTTTLPMDMRAIIARGFSVDFSSNQTAISMVGVSNTNKMRASMGASLMGTKGPTICTTVAMSGQTLTADAAPFAICSWPTIAATNGAGTAVAQPVGAGGSVQDLYTCTAQGQHPVVLAANEGVIIQPAQAGPASGTWIYTCAWDWAEVSVY